MTSLARPSSALLSRSTIRSSQLRRSLPSIYASSTADSRAESMVVKSQQRFQSGTTMKHKSTKSTFTSFASRRMSQFRAFHGTPCLSDDAAAAPAEEASEGSSEPHPTEIEYAFTPPPPLSEESLQKVNGLFERILHLDLIEVHLLTMVVNEQLGLKWNQVPGAGAGPMGGGGGAAAAEEAAPEEKTLFDLKLVGFDAKAKIKVIKEVRSIAGLGLKEAKELVEGAPKVIQKDLKLDKAEELKALLEAAGAQVELS